MKKSDVKRIFILAGFVLIFLIFTTVLIIDSNNSSPTGFITGYVVMEGGTRIKTDKLDSALVEEINEGNNAPKVVVLMEEDEDTASLDLETRKKAIAEKQQEVLNSLEDEIESSNLEITRNFDSVNGFSGKINDPQALLELTKVENVRKILLDYPVEISLDESAAHINADDIWDFSVAGYNLTGEGQTVCIIDTGIDYTHDALEGCNPLTFLLNGSAESLANPVESEHPYNNSLDQTWQVTMPGYEKIALHFENISLEKIPFGADTLDRVYIYDKDFNILAVYKEFHEDIWTPYGDGDTIYVRLVTDGSVRDYGFHIDQAINGTTNTTMDWSSCSKVIGGWDAFNNDADPKDDHGHGTHVAGIVASVNETYKGIAPDAKLVALKVLSSAGSGHSSDVISGIDWCNSNADRLNISVISMSLGCGGGGCLHHQNFCNTDLTADAINTSYQKNISVFIAAGNGGWTDGISNPACVQHAFPVGGVDSGDGISYNRGKLLQLLAPATGIKSSVLSHSWSSFSGTSMATPHAAGAAVLMRQYWGLVYNEIPTPDEIAGKFFSTGTLIQDPGGSGLNFSRIDVEAALTPIISFAGNSFAADSVTDVLTSTEGVLINITSDVPIQEALLQWSYPNGSVINLTMDASEAVSSSDDSSNKNQFYTAYNLHAGEHSYQIFAIDDSGLASLAGVTESKTFAVEEIAPEITPASPSNNSYLNADFRLNFTVNGSGLEYVSYTIKDSGGSVVLTEINDSVVSGYENKSGVLEFTVGEIINISIMTEGRQIIEIFANNTLGKSATGEIEFVLDTASPVISAVNVLPETIYENNATVFNFTISDENLDTSAILFSSDYSGNNGSWINYSISSMEDGVLNNTYNYNISASILAANQIVSYRLYSADLAGNRNDLEVLNLTVLPQPEGPVIPNITSPVNGTVAEVGSSVSFKVQTNLSNASFYWTFADDTTSDQQNVSKTYTDTGSFNVVVNITDNVDGDGEQQKLSVDILINDTQAPALDSIDYLDEVHLQRDGNQTITVESSDYSDISETILSVSSYSGILEVCSMATCAWNLTNLSTGDYDFTINVSDNFSPVHVLSSSYSFSVTSCSDSVRNGNEAKVDCGGSCDTSCPEEDDDSSDSGSDTSSGSSSGSSSSGGGGAGRAAAPSGAALPENFVSEDLLPAELSDEGTDIDDTDTDGGAGELETEESGAVEFVDAELRNSGGFLTGALTGAGEFTGAFVSNLFPPGSRVKRGVYVAAGIIMVGSIVLYGFMRRRKRVISMSTAADGEAKDGEVKEKSRKIKFEFERDD